MISSMVSRFRIEEMYHQQRCHLQLNEMAYKPIVLCASGRSSSGEKAYTEVEPGKETSDF